MKTSYVSRIEAFTSPAWSFLRRLVEASIPTADAPPVSIVKWEKECIALGRHDLAKQIREGWARALEKHKVKIFSDPAKMWGAATNVGTNSVKKNVFQHQEFSVWLAAQAKLPQADQQTAAALNAPEYPAGTPAIMMPKSGETIDDWQAAKAKTGNVLDQVDQAFNTVEDLMTYLETNMGDLQRMIATYGPGGAKAVNKGGSPSKMSERVPKWKDMLVSYKQKYDLVKENYNKSPAMTVEFEQTAQAEFAKILSFILKIDDLEQQKGLMKQFNDAVSKQKKKPVETDKDKNKDKDPTTASIVVTAGLFDSFTNFVRKMTSSVKSWFMTLDKELDHANDVMTLKAAA